MRKYIITSNSFTGEVYAVYSAQGILQQIDFSTASIQPNQVDWIKSKLPVIGTPAEAFGSANLTVTDEAFAITFEMFWDKYRKAINKKRCIPKWERLSKADQAAAYAGIILYDRYLQKNSWRSKADPDTYLTDKYWQTDWK